MNKQQTQRYQLPGQEENEPIQLNEALEPYDTDDLNAPLAYGEYSEEDYDESYIGEEYSDAHEAFEVNGRFKVAMGVFDTVSILVGVLVIFALVALLLSLLNWLRSDIMHSVLLIQTGLQ
ncbi:MAG: hypothetical protein RR696_07310 [Clostridia bacterium]